VIMATIIMDYVVYLFTASMRTGVLALIMDGIFMILFLEKTWPLWWIFAVVVILRWFHVVSANSESHTDDSAKYDQNESNVMSGRIASRA
jgi:hypothetical protein